MLHKVHKHVNPSQIVLNFYFGAGTVAKLILVYNDVFTVGNKRRYQSLKNMGIKIEIST